MVLSASSLLALGPAELLWGIRRKHSKIFLKSVWMDTWSECFQVTLQLIWVELIFFDLAIQVTKQVKYKCNNFTMYPLDGSLSLSFPFYQSHQDVLYDDQWSISRNLIVCISIVKEILAQWLLACEQGNVNHKNSSLSEIHLPTVPLWIWRKSEWSLESIWVV